MLERLPWSRQARGFRLAPVCLSPPRSLPLALLQPGWLNTVGGSEWVSGLATPAAVDVAETGTTPSACASSITKPYHPPVESRC